MHGDSWRILRLAGAVAVVGAVLATIGGQASAGPASSSQAPTGTLNIGLSSLLESFDPAVAQPVAKVHLDLLYDHVVGLNPTGNRFSKETGLASNWTTKDLQTWKFKIRRGVKFSNGDPLTARDVAFSLGRLKTPVARSAYASWFKLNLASAKATGATNLTIRLTNPNFGLLYYLSSLFGNEGSVVPSNYLRKVGDAGFAQAPIGSGPYKIESRQAGQSITYVPSNTKSPVKPKYARVVFRIIPETSSRIALYRTRQLDVIDIGTASIKTLGGIPSTKIKKKRVGNQVGLGFFEQWKTTTPMNKKAFRQALALSVDAKAINKAIFRGFGDVTGNYPSGCASLGCKELAPYAYNPTQAKQLLEQSGYSGAEVPIYAFPLPGVPELPALATAIQAYWKAIGVNAKVVTTDFSSFVGKWVSYTVGTGAAPVAFAQRALGVAQYDSAFWSKGVSTFTHDSTIDGLVDQGHAAGDSPKKYGQITAQLNQYVHDNYLSLPIVSLGSFYAGKDDVVADWFPGNGQYDMNIRFLAGR